MLLRILLLLTGVVRRHRRRRQLIKRFRDVRGFQYYRKTLRDRPPPNGEGEVPALLRRGLT